jgi:hypothetical protein
MVFPNNLPQDTVLDAGHPLLRIKSLQLFRTHVGDSDRAGVTSRSACDTTAGVRVCAGTASTGPCRRFPASAAWMGRETAASTALLSRRHGNVDEGPRSVPFAECAVNPTEECARGNQGVPTRAQRRPAWDREARDFHHFRGMTMLISALLRGGRLHDQLPPFRAVSGRQHGDLKAPTNRG